MASIKLNHAKVRKLMKEHLMRPIDLANKIEKDRQTVHYILNSGGIKYAEQLAKIFGCKKSDLLVDTSRN